MTTPDPNRVIAVLARSQAGVDLKPIDLCFLAGLHLRADRSALASFDEDTLLDMFGRVCDVVDPGVENSRIRATYAIQRLREQRMLTRIDGAGIVHAGEYALTQLASAIVEFYIADETLTRESLTLLTTTLRASLADILSVAKKAKTEDAWRIQVAGAMRVTVSELVGGIERRKLIVMTAKCWIRASSMSTARGLEGLCTSLWATAAWFAASGGRIRRAH